MNKKGFTLVEIIVSISLISIVVIFLFQIIITIKNLNDSKVNKTNNQMAVAVVTREVEKDLNSFGLEQDPTETCDITKTNVIPATAENIKCIKLIYRSINVKNNEGYIIYYKNRNNNKYFLAYKRGKDNIIETQTVRELNIKENTNVDVNISKEESDDMYSLKLVVPIRNNQDKYDVVISYIDSIEVIKNSVNIYAEGGELIEKVGEGEYKKGTSVTVKYLYDTTKYLLEDVSCSNVTCQTNGSTISFIMPETNVNIKITLKKRTYNLLNHLLSLDKTSNGLEVDDTSDQNLRYVGANPNNYISFNNEIWRIIGIFNVYNNEIGRTEKLVKIIRNDSLGNYSWDTAESSINYGYRVNEWSQAALMIELNTDYIDTSKTNGTTTWYNSSGKNGIYDYSNNIKSCFIEKIANISWNLGGYTNYQSSVKSYYNAERGTNHISNPSDGITRTNTWNGKIGLMYPSDYGYASTDVGCRNNLYNCDKYLTNNWLFNGGNQWTLSPSSGYAISVFTVHNSGDVSDSFVVSNNFGVRPVLFLKSDTQITTGGVGTNTNPFTIG